MTEDYERPDDKQGLGCIAWTMATIALAIALAMMSCGCINIQRPTTVYVIVTNHVQQVAPPSQYSFPAWTVPGPTWPPSSWSNGMFSSTNYAIVQCN